MTVYVDELRNYAGMYHGDQKEHAQRVGRKHGDLWCHMFTDQQDQDELHKMARKIGLRTSYHQGDHYDIIAPKREQAIALGAVETSCEEASMILVYDRHGRERPSYGYDHLEPATIVEGADDGAPY